MSSLRNGTDLWQLESIPPMSTSSFRKSSLTLPLFSNRRGNNCITHLTNVAARTCCTVAVSMRGSMLQRSRGQPGRDMNRKRPNGPKT